MGRPKSEQYFPSFRASRGEGAQVALKEIGFHYYASSHILSGVLGPKQLGNRNGKLLESKTMQKNVYQTQTFCARAVLLDVDRPTLVVFYRGPLWSHISSQLHRLKMAELLNLLNRFLLLFHPSDVIIYDFTCTIVLLINSFIFVIFNIRHCLITN